MTDYGPDHAAEVDRHMREQDRLADLEAAADRERDTLQAGDKVRLLEAIRIAEDYSTDDVRLPVGTIGEVVQPLSQTSNVWIVCFGGTVGEAAVDGADLERIHDD